MWLIRNFALSGGAIYTQRRDAVRQVRQVRRVGLVGRVGCQRGVRGTEGSEWAEETFLGRGML